MRVIVVDNDSTMLEATVRALREHFVIDAVTNKADCIDLLRQNDFDIVIACERLEDGSGLELLGQIAKRWPATLRVFAADRERLRLLQGKLGPFELFQALSYPINPDKLLATLSLAREAHEAHADTTTIQHIVLGGDDPTESAPEPPPPPPPPPPAPRAKAGGVSTRSPASSSATRSQSSNGRAHSSSLTSGRGPMTFDASFPLGSSGADSPSRAGAGSLSGASPAARTSSGSSAPASPPRGANGSSVPASQTPASLPRGGSYARSARNDAPPQTPSFASASAPRAAARSAPAASTSAPDEGASPTQTSSARAWSGRTFARPNAAAGSSGTRGHSTDPLAEAASIAAAARSRLDPDESDGTPTHRKAFIAGAGCAVVLFVVGFLVLEFKSGPTLAPTPPPPIPQAPQYAREVTDQVSEVETDFETDDFKKAQADVRKLQAMAPDHPRLQFFKTLIDRGLKAHAVAGRDSAGPSKSGAARKMTASASKSEAAPAASGVAEGSKASASSPPSRPSLASTFSGRTVEESNAPLAVDAPHAHDAGDAASSNALGNGAPTGSAATGPTNAAAVGAPGGAATTATSTAAIAPTNTAGTTSTATAPMTAAAAVPTNTAGTAATGSVAADPRRTAHSAIPVVTAEAQLTRRVAPEYPDSAMRKGIQGYVDVQFTITAQGTVTNVAVVSSDPGEVFDRAATDAVRRWRYDPRVVDGQPVDSQSQVRLQFKLDHSLSH